jgi:hypothetical protein
MGRSTDRSRRASVAPSLLTGPSWRVALGVFFLMVFFSPSLAHADLGDCAQPVTTGSEPAVTDCLFILQSAVGLTQCEPECICDVDGSAAVSVVDAQLCLALVTGQGVASACPCETPTTTSTTLIVRTYTLTVEKSGSGSGTVASTPAGIACGNQCVAVFDDGDMVDLVATPAADSQFDRWKNGPCSGSAGCTVTMTKNRSVTAKFVTTTLPACPFAGNYTGMFKGDDRGIFEVDVDSDCNMDGEFFSTVFNEADSVLGEVDPVTGEVDARTQFGRTRVTGEMTTDGSVSGDWRSPDGDKGTWSGNRN